MKKAGFVVLIIGLVITIVTSISFFTKEEVVDIGKIEITRDKKHTASWSPLWGVGVMVVGVGMIMFGKKG